MNKKNILTPLETIDENRRVILSLAGFALFETVLVVVIMGILAAVIVPRFAASGYGRMRARSVTSQLAADLRYARSLAITNSDHYYVVFDFAAQPQTTQPARYTIYRGSVAPPHKIGETKQFPLNVFYWGSTEIRFFSWGSSSGGTCQVSVTTPSIMAYMITIDAPTGVVRVEKQS